MRVIAGPEKKARLLSEKERKITAYHEMGHALVGHYLENTNPVHKIDRLSRPGARPHDLAADGGQVPDDEVDAHGQARHDARRARRGKPRLPRGDDRRSERPRAGHGGGEADDHALRDVREARPARPRPRTRCRSSGATWAPSPTTRTRSQGDRRRDPARDRGRARRDHRPARTWTSCTASRRSSSSARRSTRIGSSGSWPARPRSRSSRRRSPSRRSRSRRRRRSRSSARSLVRFPALRCSPAARSGAQLAPLVRPAGFEPPLGLDGDAFRLEPLGPRAQRARLRRVVVEHRAHPRVARIRAGQSLAARDEPRGEPRRSRAPRARLRRTDGLHVHGARRQRRRGRLPTSIRRETASTTPTFSRGCAHRVPTRSATQGGHCRLAARTGLAVRAAALRAVARLTLAAGDEDDRGDTVTAAERRSGRARGWCAHRVHERRQSRRDEECSRTEQRDDRGPPQAFAALSEPARPLLERPVAEPVQSSKPAATGARQRRAARRLSRAGRVQPSCECRGAGISGAQPSDSRRARRSATAPIRTPTSWNGSLPRDIGTPRRREDTPRCRRRSLCAGQSRVAPVRPLPPRVQCRVRCRPTLRRRSRVRRGVRGAPLARSQIRYASFSASERPGSTSGTGSTSTTATSKRRARRSSSAVTKRVSTSGVSPSTSDAGGRIRAGMVHVAPGVRVATPVSSIVSMSR